MEELFKQAGLEVKQRSAETPLPEPFNPVMMWALQ